MPGGIDILEAEGLPGGSRVAVQTHCIELPDTRIHTASPTLLMSIFTACR